MLVPNPLVTQLVHGYGFTTEIEALLLPDVTIPDLVPTDAYKKLRRQHFYGLPFFCTIYLDRPSSEIAGFIVLRCRRTTQPTQSERKLPVEKFFQLLNSEITFKIFPGSDQVHYLMWFHPLSNEISVRDEPNLGYYITDIRSFLESV